MRKVFQNHWPFLIVLLLVSYFHLWGIKKVPFHPDEATQLFMSSDFEALLSQPGSLAWHFSKENDTRQLYRELDAPLTKYLLGLGRTVFGTSPLPTDWDWSKSWEQNAMSGAMPDPVLLFAGRLAVTLLIPGSLVLIYLLGLQTGGRLTGLFAALLLGTHTLVLLHARRAMAEGVLVFGLLFASWSLLQAGKRPWLTGLGLAIAFNAKQSLAALLPVGLIAVVWGSFSGDSRDIYAKLRKSGGALLQFLAVFGLITAALNPLYWRTPLAAAQASWAARQDLLARQLADTARFTPAQVLESPGERLAVLLANLYLMPPRFEEIGNYQEQTAESAQAYLSVPGHVLLRGLAGGGVMLALTILGLVFAGLLVWRKGLWKERRLALLLLATLFQSIALVLAIPLPFQRYSMPLVPLAVFWSAYGLARLIQIRTTRA